MDIGLHFFGCFHVPSICRVPCRKFVQKVISHPPPPPTPPLLSISEHVQHVSNRRSATCQKQQPLQGRRISRMPKESLGYLPFAGQTNIMRKCNNVGSRLVWGSTIVSPGSKIILDLWEWLGATLLCSQDFGICFKLLCFLLNVFHFFSCCTIFLSLKTILSFFKLNVFISNSDPK